MDDIQTILYIAIGVIYLLARVLKRKKPAPPPSQDAEQIPQVEHTPKTPERKKPLSFEQVIREISGQAATREPEPKPEPEIQISDSDAQSTYKKSIKAAKRVKKRKIGDIKIPSARIGLFQNYDTEEKGRNYLAEEIARSLKNNRDIKKAIVINEILTRKYD